MAKVRINLDRKKSLIEAALKRGFTSQELQRQVGELLVRNSKASARLGKNPNTGQKYPGLRKSTIRNRQYLSRYNTTSEFSRGNRPMNFTGQLVNSTNYLSKRFTNRIQWTLTAEGSRRPYKTQTGRVRKTPTNAELAAIHQKDRPVLGVSDETLKVAKQLIIANLRRQLFTV